MQAGETIRETAAEVAAKIPQYSWEIMDDDQRDALFDKVIVKRYMKQTRDGVTLGPAWWGDLLGCERTVIKNRWARRQARDQDKGVRATSPTAAELSHLRGAKAALRKHPELAEKLVDDPKVLDHVLDASAKATGQTRTRPVETDTDRHFDATDLFLKVNSAHAAVLRRLPDYRPNSGLREEAEYAATGAETFASFVRDWAEGVSIADEVGDYLKAAQ